MRKLLFVGIAMLLLSGCAISPDYQRPTIKTPATWTVSYEAAAGMIDSAWWKQFNDPVLDKLITTALTNNLDLMAATARVDQFLGQFRTTRSEAFPQIGASAGISRQQDTKTGPIPGATLGTISTRERLASAGRLISGIEFVVRLKRPRQI